MKKLIALSLVAAMLMSAMGCAKKSDDTSSAPIETITVSQTLYKEDRLELPADFSWCAGMVCSEEQGLRIFYSDKDLSPKMAIYDKDLKLVSTTVLDMGENAMLSDIAQSDDGTICALCTVTIPPEDDSIELYSEEYWEKTERTLAVRYFSFDGELISTDELGDLEETAAGNSFISSFSKCGDDYLFNVFGEAILADKKGKIKKRRPDNGGTYISDKEGCIWYCHTSYMSRTETLTDPAAMIEYPEGSMMSRPPVPGDDKFPMYLMQSDGLYGMTRGGQMIKLIDYASSLLSVSEISSVCRTGEEEFVISGHRESGAYVSVLRSRPEDYTEERQTVIVGIHNVVNSGDMDMGTEFSRLNDKYNVEFREYSWESDDLKADILSDNAPDVYQFDDISEMHRYANMGAFADIDEISAKYGGMSSSDLLPNIVEAMRYKGGLYAIPKRFQVKMYIASGEVVPKEYSDWTLDEFFEIAENMPEGMAIGDNITMRGHSDTMFFLCNGNIAQWVDPERAECRFDSDEFIRVLNFCKDVNYAEPYDYENDSPESGSETFHMLVNKKALLYSPSFMGSLRYFKQQTALNSMSIDEATLVNPPGSSGGSIVPERFLAVMNNGKCQQGGWEFLSYVMSYDKQVGYSPFFFPVEKEAFEQSLKDQAKVMNTEGVSIDTFNQYEYTVDPHISDEEVEYLRERFLSCSNISGGYDEIRIICTEESDRFFADECSAEECAGMIQNRVSIYLSENYK